MIKLKSIVLKTRFLYLGIKNIFKLNLMDIVIYENEKWMITNGIGCPKWNIHRLSDNKRLEYVHQDKFRKQFSVRNIKNAIKRTYHFYMGYWYSIFMRELTLKECLFITYKNFSYLVDNRENEKPEYNPRKEV